MILAHDLCRHCHERPTSSGRRGLCRTCYATPAVRELFPSKCPRWKGGCRECGRKRQKAYRRGLCGRCYIKPLVRAKYPLVDPRPAPHANPVSKLAPGPTAATPGTLAKLLSLRERAALNLSLFHPADARADLS